MPAAVRRRMACTPHWPELDWSSASPSSSSSRASFSRASWPARSEAESDSSRLDDTSSRTGGMPRVGVRSVAAASPDMLLWPRGVAALGGSSRVGVCDGASSGVAAVSPPWNGSSSSGGVDDASRLSRLAFGCAGSSVPLVSFDATDCAAPDGASESDSLGLRIELSESSPSETFGARYDTPLWSTDASGASFAPLS